MIFRHRIARRSTIALVSVAACAGFASRARATDYPVFASQLTMRSRDGRGALRLVLPRPFAPLPTPGGADDPSISGMTLTLVSRGGGGTATFTAPAGSGKNSWKVRTSPTATYTFHDGGAGAGDIQSFAWRGARGGLRLSTRDAGLSLDGAQGPVAVRIEFGSTRVCALFGGVERETAGFFTARGGSAVALADCDDATLAGTP